MNMGFYSVTKGGNGWDQPGWNFTYLKQVASNVGQLLGDRHWTTGLTLPEIIFRLWRILLGDPIRSAVFCVNYSCKFTFQSHFCWMKLMIFHSLLNLNLHNLHNLHLGQSELQPSWRCWCGALVTRSRGPWWSLGGWASPRFACYKWGNMIANQSLLFGMLSGYE